MTTPAGTEVEILVRDEGYFVSVIEAAEDPIDCEYECFDLAGPFTTSADALDYIANEMTGPRYQLIEGFDTYRVWN